MRSDSSPISSRSIYNCPIGKYNDSKFDNNNNMTIVTPKTRKLMHSLSRQINKNKKLILNTDGIGKQKCISQKLTNSTKGII